MLLFAPKCDPGIKFRGFFRISEDSHSQLLYFYWTDSNKNWKLFSYWSKNFISAILAARVKIRVPSGMHSSVGFSEILKIICFWSCTLASQDRILFQKQIIFRISENPTEECMSEGTLILIRAAKIAEMKFLDQ